MFNNWAQPVVSKPWAAVCTVFETAMKATGYRLFGPSTHRAWEKACGIEKLS